MFRHEAVLDNRGPIWACDSSLEQPRPQNEHMMDARAPVRAARPQWAKMYLHKPPQITCLRLQSLKRMIDNLKILALNTTINIPLAEAAHPHCAKPIFPVDRAGGEQSEPSRHIGLKQPRNI